MINHLIASFRSLRKDPLWTHTVAGGIWFVQIVPKPAKATWHVHLHIVMDSLYIPQKRLADTWQRITIDSRIVDIRRIWSPDHAARYVSRYVARPIDLAVLSDIGRDDAVSSTAGLHLIGVFGNAQGKGVLTREVIDKAAWVYIADYRTIAELWQSDPDARAVWTSWRTKTPLPFTPNFDEYERDLDGTVPSASRSPPKPTEATLWNA